MRVQQMKLINKNVVIITRAVVSYFLRKMRVTQEKRAVTENKTL